MSTAYAEHQPGGLPEDTPDQGLAPDDELLFDPETVEGERGLPRHTVLVGNIGLLLPHDEVSELIEKATVCGLPNTRPWFDGITSIRGNMVPVFDLHALFSIEPPARRRLIVVGENRTAAAFWVDAFPRLLVFEDEDATTAEPPIPSLVREHALGYFLQDGQAWVEWDCKSFFAALGEQV